MLRGQRGLISFGVGAAALLVVLALLRFGGVDGGRSTSGAPRAARGTTTVGPAPPRPTSESAAAVLGGFTAPPLPLPPTRSVIVVIRFANRFGRHSNQLKGHLHAVALAQLVARRLPTCAGGGAGTAYTVHVVLEPFSSGGDKASGAAFSALYNMSALEGVANANIGGAGCASPSPQPDAAAAEMQRVRLHDRVDQVLTQQQKQEAVAAGGAGRGDEEHLVFPRRGIPSKLPYPRQRAFLLLGGGGGVGGELRAAADDAAPKTKSVALTTRDFERVATIAADAVAASLGPSSGAAVAVRQLFFYELVYYDGVVDQSASVRGGAPGIADALWGGLHPSAEVERSIALAGIPAPSSPSSSSTGAEVYDAVHVRTLEGSCVERLATLIRRRKLPFPMPAAGAGATTSMAPDALHWQCRLGQRFRNIRERLAVVNAAAGKAPEAPAPVFLAVDDAAIKRRLVAEAAAGDGGAGPPGRALSASLRGGGGGGAGHGMLVDFWLCVRATGRFVGNAASTLSRNVCYVRRAQGRIAVDDPVDCRFVIRP